MSRGRLLGLAGALTVASLATVHFNSLAVEGNEHLAETTLQEHMLLSCANFIDSSTNWKVEFTNFQPDSCAPESQLSLQVMRLQNTFAGTNGTLLPCMRIIAFFPGIQSTTLFQLLTNRERRLRWDFNYQMFEKYAGKDENQPVGPAFSHSVPSLGDVKWGNITEQGWALHRVGSSALRRFGVLTREFLYHYWCFCYDEVGGVRQGDCSRPLPPMFNIVYDGSESTQSAARQHRSFAEWENTFKDKESLVRCKMNYQHIALIPVANWREQRKEFDSLASSGSFIGGSTFLKYYNFFKTSAVSWKAKEHDNKNGGTLFVITSINDVGLSDRLPQWVQRAITSTMTVKVYNALMEAALSFQQET